MRLTLPLAAALLVPAVAHASGGGMSANWGGQGASAPGRVYTYVTLPTERGTLVAAVQRWSGEIDRWRHFSGRYGVPQVGYDGSMTGLSADGRVLVLTEIPRTFPIRRTRLLIMNPTRFHRIERFSFPGWYSVTAISPHGRYVYLQRYTAPSRDPSRSEVVVFDRGNPGAPEAISAPASGLPTARATDGRWAYTLNQGDASWVQALDTVTQRVRRFEVPRLRGNDLVRLRLNGNRLRVGKTVTLTVPGA
ncbi:hypothetical protein OJ997_14355 [Solirubrobacter phytolaccae]|uniref:DUF3108 domain-containing protein n=1 Tax=Solirubrobacter phytolaccae TaxID=1404360 RepID=A0A9X3N849_9ACTN|nr:hypothetical protein [Solirubrobacter phytolaccae]MDA0181483.1 hypothetical protein [Solirubrobacter phytolaccae]